MEEKLNPSQHLPQKRIVILGAGFAGLRTALLLSKKLRHRRDIQIILVDERDTHVYTPDLYEIATAYNKKITQECLTLLKESVATPFSKIVFSGHVEMIRDRVIAIHPASLRLGLELKNRGALSFDYLILTLGSVTNYYNIPGLTQFSYPLKTLTDALAICCHLDIYFHTLWKKETKKKVAIVVGGGGATGVEFVCELPGYIDKLCRKYDYPREHVEIIVVEGSGQLTGQGEKVTNFILKRFSKLRIKAILSTFIKEVTVNTLTAETAGQGKSQVPCDILIWTGGVMPHPLIRESFPEVAKNGALPVNAFLQHEKFSNIFAAGDNAFFLDQKSGKPIPMLAQIAVQQAKTLAHNMAAEIEGSPKKPFMPSIKGVIIPLGGKYALLKKGNFIFTGLHIWFLQRLVDLVYLLRILPFRYAVKKWVHDTNVFVEND